MLLLLLLLLLLFLLLLLLLLPSAVCSFNPQFQCSHSGNYCVHQGCKIWHLNWVTFSPTGTNLGLFKIKIFKDLSQLGRIWPILDAKFYTPDMHLVQVEAQSVIPTLLFLSVFIMSIFEKAIIKTICIWMNFLSNVFYSFFS